MQKIQEGKATFIASQEKIVTKDMDVFYNPLMKMNRDMTILLLNAIPDKNIRLADILAGSGVRSVRFMLELERDKINEIHINDYSEKAVNTIKENLKLNKITSQKIKITNKDANDLLRESKGFEYIDIDPFGSPVRFLESAILRLSRGGILAVTATDVAALAGSSSGACKRKYWATPSRNEFMHETGLRILIRRVQLSGAMYEKALTPILSYYKDHYMRAFFRCEKGRQKVDKILKMHDYISYCRKCLWRGVGYKECENCNNKTDKIGPIWTGKTNENKLLKEMIKNSQEKEFLKTLYNETKIKEPYFYNVHKVAQKYKKGECPSNQQVIKAIKSKGYKAELTHYKREGIKSNIGIKELGQMISQAKSFK